MLKPPRFVKAKVLGGGVVLKNTVGVFVFTGSQRFRPRFKPRPSAGGAGGAASSGACIRCDLWVKHCGHSGRFSLQWPDNITHFFFGGGSKSLCLIMRSVGTEIFYGD